VSIVASCLFVSRLGDPFFYLDALQLRKGIIPTNKLNSATHGSIYL